MSNEQAAVSPPWPNGAAILVAVSEPVHGGGLLNFSRQSTAVATAPAYWAAIGELGGGIQVAYQQNGTAYITGPIDRTCGAGFYQP